jgi:hypothetical protein
LCPVHNFFKDQGILEIFLANVYNNKTMCRAQHPDLYIQGQGQMWRSKLNMVCYNIYFGFSSIKGFLKYLAQMLPITRWRGVCNTQMPTFKVKVKLKNFSSVNRPHILIDEKVTDLTRKIPCNRPYPVLILYLSHFVALK